MSSIIAIDQSALANNLKFLKSLYHSDVKISSVVKGNAYGHGLDVFAPIAEAQGIDHFSVYSADEARVLRKTLKPTTIIMIMGYIDDDDLEWTVSEQIPFFVFDFHRLEAAIAFAKKHKTKAKIHIELETGMNRTGFGEHELNDLIEKVVQNEDALIVDGICTHFAGAESISNHVRVQDQKENYLTMSHKLEVAGIKANMKHTCCSAASIRLPEMQLDMVRVGILQYGFWPSREIFIEYLKNKKIKSDPLKRVISWQSKIMNIKHIEMGEFVGYGTTYLAQKDMLIAVVPVGYSHGFSRTLSNIGRVLVNGTRTSIIGMVNMNCAIIDATDIPDLKINDKVTLIGSDGIHEITVSSFSELSDQLNYELLTRLPHNIPRIIN